MRHLATPFRLFFMAAAALACAAVALWYLSLSGRIAIASELSPMGWHAHEMIFGYLGAVLAGFLLTAAATWTGLPTIGGKGVGVLLVLWLTARIVHGLGLEFAGSSGLGLLFFAWVAIGIGRPIVVAGRWRNAPFAILMLVMGLGDLLIHLAADGTLDSVWATRGLWISIDSVAMVIFIFAGRILPLFTKNALGLAKVREKGVVDVAGLVALGALMVAHALSARTSIEGPLWAASGVLTIARLYGWGGSKTLRTPLLWVLHLGWFLAGSGMLLVAYALYAPLAMALTTAHHLLFVGGFGTLSLGMMARVALGHTGREKIASRLASAAFALMIVATVARVVASLLRPGLYVDALFVAALAWSAAFVAFLWVYGPVLLAARSDGKPG